jgi:hypothetical protein
MGKGISTVTGCAPWKPIGFLLHFTAAKRPAGPIGIDQSNRYVLFPGASFGMQIVTCSVRSDT